MQSDHDVNNNRRKQFKGHFMSWVSTSLFVLFGTKALFTPWGMNNAQLLKLANQDSTDLIK